MLTTKKIKRIVPQSSGTLLIITALKIRLADNTGPGSEKCEND
jgi:hypothetical protein